MSSPSLKSGCAKSKSIGRKFESTGLKSKSQKTGLESDSTPSPGLEYYISGFGLVLVYGLGKGLDLG